MERPSGALARGQGAIETYVARLLAECASSGFSHASCGYIFVSITVKRGNTKLMSKENKERNVPCPRLSERFPPPPPTIEIGKKRRWGGRG